MAIYIKITKVLEKRDIGFYHVFTKHGGDTEFYVGFDRHKNKIYCFLTETFLQAIRTIDLNNPNEVIGEIPGIKVEASILAKIFRTARRVFELNEFPQCLDYCA